MRRSTMSRVLSIATALLLLALLPGAVLADDGAAVQSPPQFGGTLPHGSWAAFSFSYGGDYSKVGVFLNYSPSDDPADSGQGNGQAVILRAYSPNSLPPGGNPIAQAGGNGGEKYWQLESGLSGTYVIIVENWDSLNRPVNFSVRTVSPGTLSDPHGAPAGPTLAFLSANLDAVVEGLGGANPTVVAAPAGQGSAPNGSPSASGALSAGSAWVSYSFPYPGDGSTIALVLDYTTSGKSNGDSAADATLVTLAAYGPGDEPSAQTPLAYASGLEGQVVWTLTSAQAGTYTIVLNNWDSLGRPVTFTLRSVALQPGSDLVNAPSGPALTFVAKS